jgi:hypothetical protein
MAEKIITHALYTEIIDASPLTKLSAAPHGRANSTTLSFRTTNDRAADFRRRAKRLGFASPSHALRALADAAGDPETIARLTNILGLPDNAETDAIIAKVRELLGVDDLPDGDPSGEGAPEVADPPIPMALYPGGKTGPAQRLSDAVAKHLGVSGAAWSQLKKAAVKRTPVAPTRRAPAATTTKLSAEEIAGCKRLGISAAELQARKKAFLRRA